MLCVVLLPPLSCAASSETAGLDTSSETADLDNGRRLHEAHCVRCHDARIYVREERRVNSLKALRAQVRACELAAELGWFEEEVADVAAWLQQMYYRFGQAP